MPIDLSGIEPLTPKKALLEQALTQVHPQAGGEDALPDDLKWLREDQTALRELVKEMDTRIGDLAQQLRHAQTVLDNGKRQLDREQRLLFRQIKTLNALMKQQTEALERINQQLIQFKVEENRILPQIGIALIAGLVAGITVVVSLPWIQALMQG